MADCGLEISYRFPGWYTARLTDQHQHTYTGNKTAKACGETIRKAMIPCDQVTIVEGHESTSYFWIRPVRQDVDHDVRYHAYEEISIEELDVLDYLYPFLKKYFDPDFSYVCRDGWCGNGFVWNLEHNLYTYDTVRTMLKEIDRSADLLLHHFSDPELEELKNHFRERISSGLSSFERNRKIREKASLAADFYDRFSRRMRLMMKYAPEFDLISVMGP